MTPTQLRAYATVARLGSVKAAAAELELSESAVSMHVKSLRDELADSLFVRSGGGIAFTPGGLRLATRAHEMLGLQDQTRREVQEAAAGKRLLRLGTSALFAEYAAAGLIELFSSKARDLAVELSVVPTGRLVEAVRNREVDLAIGPEVESVAPPVSSAPVLRYELVAVTAADGLRSGGVREANWMLGPAAAEPEGVTPRLLRSIGVPESRQRIYQSNAAALDQVRRGHGIGLTLGFRVNDDLGEGRLRVLGLDVPDRQGTWVSYALPDHDLPPAAAELRRFMTRPRATQAMIAGTGTGIDRFRPKVHVTLWS